jgi:hypothetical protein
MNTINKGAETIVNRLFYKEMQRKANTFLYSCLSTWHKGAIKFFETVTKFKSLEIIEHNQNYNHEEI